MQVLKDGLNRIIIPPIHNRTLIWLHGFGDTSELFCEDFASFPIIPNCKVVLPTAPCIPIPCRDNTLSTAWYTNLGDPNPDDSIEPSISRILSIISKESQHTNCIILGGFSQGAALSLMCGLCRYEGSISAIIALSGFAFNAPVLENKKSVPVLLYHGGQDTIVPLERAQESFDRNLQGVNYHLEVNPAMPHEVYAEEYEFIRNWTRNALKYS